jgi:tetratricopeptide (TPR) repeat protein
MKKLGIAGFSTLFCLASAMPVMAQAQPSATEVACNNKARALYAKPDDMKLFDDFVNDPTCKDSMYREPAYSQLMQKLVPAMKWKEVYDLSIRYEREVPNPNAGTKKYMISSGMTAGSGLGDLDKILEMGEKILVIDPMDLNAIVFVSNSLPDKYLKLTDQAAKDKNLNRAQELAKQLLAMKRPEQLPEQTWQQSVVGPAHAVLGFVALQRLQYPEASGEYQQAVKINPKDQMSWFRDGTARVYIASAAQKPLKDLYDAVNAITVAGPERDAAIEKRDAAVKEYTEKRDAAMEPLATAAAMGGPVGSAAKTQLESLWKPPHNDTTEGMDEFIAKHKI